VPNGFQLTRGGVAVPLAEVDEEMCRHFEEPCDPVRYFRAWYDCIGYDLAMGRSFEEIKTIYGAPEYADSGLLAVAEWLQANFSPRSWYEPSSPRGNTNAWPCLKIISQR
jgi:hypothetical protein